MWKKKSTKKADTLWFNEILKHVPDKDIATIMLGMFGNRDTLFSKQRPQDDDYGYNWANPIMTSSVNESEQYLSKLHTLDGRKFTWKREGSLCVNIHGIQNVMVDKYCLSLENMPYKTIYICPYAHTSSDAPKGLSLKESLSYLISFGWNAIPGSNQSQLNQIEFEPIACRPWFIFADCDNILLDVYDANEENNAKKVRLGPYFSEIQSPRQITKSQIHRQYCFTPDYAPKDIASIDVNLWVFDRSMTKPLPTIKDITVSIATIEGKQLCQYTLEESISTLGHVKLCNLYKESDNWSFKAIGIIDKAISE
ncbi:MAG: hypothetical protein IK127_04010 [Clostridia bacterium]|nr:hypothetical protein [Clostridia bacterium]